MCMKKLTRGNAVGTEHVWVKAHVTKERGKRKTMSQEHNDLVDELAKVSLQLGVQTGRFAASEPASELPLEDAWLTREGKKITGSVGNNLREQWARKFAKRYFDDPNVQSLGD